LGQSYHKQCNYSKALEHYRLAVELIEKHNGKDHIYTAIIFNRIGLIHSDMGNY